MIVNVTEESLQNAIGVYPFSLNISIRILNTLPYKFLLVITRRICVTIKAS